ncbi:MAG: hypothetical protein DRG76_01640 [Deltaproteobacteria bacterium]|nr:MAG: hypothetical protein DRG76_01640 [Deltaproteobacteria bacterium]
MDKAMKTRLGRAAVFAFISFILCMIPVSGCNRSQGKDDRIALIVGAKKIGLDQLREDVLVQSAGLIDPDSETFRLEGPLLQAIIEYYLIEGYAKKEGISVSEDEVLKAVQEIKKDYPDQSFQETLLHGYVDFDHWKKSLKRQILRKKVFEAVTRDVLPPSHTQIANYYKTHIKAFTRAPRVRFRQIVTRSKKEAEAALDRLRKGEPMDKLAKLYSFGPEAANGGEVGWVEIGQLVPSIEKVLFSLPVGKISPIVKSPYGYHIFEVLEVEPGGLQPLKEVAAQIQSKLYAEAREKEFKQWLDRIRGQTKVQVFKYTIERTDHPNG